MNYHLRSNRRRAVPRTGKLLFGFVIIAVLLLGGNYVTNGMVAEVVRVPAASVLGTHGVFVEQFERIAHVFSAKATLQREREALKGRVQELEIYALNNIVLSAENAELRRLLGTNGTTLNNGILARVISYAGIVPYGVVLISLESPVAVSSGAHVYGPNDTFIGTVISVRDTTATVQLVSAPTQETTAFIGATDRLTQVTLRGSGSGNMVARVARDADIRVGDPVTLVGENGPLIGFVGTIETKPSDAFQQVRVRTPFNISTVRFVRVQ